MNSCNASYVAQGLRGRNRVIALRTRLVAFAIALATLAVMANGASFVLESSPPAANELVMAKSIFAAVAGVAPTTECASRNPHPDKGKTL